MARSAWVWLCCPVRDVLCVGVRVVGMAHRHQCNALPSKIQIEECFFDLGDVYRVGAAVAERVEGPPFLGHAFLRTHGQHDGALAVQVCR